VNAPFTPTTPTWWNPIDDRSSVDPALTARPRDCEGPRIGTPGTGQGARSSGAPAYAQLIGGEVSLLPPEAHAEALEVTRRHGRFPRSFTHGDVD
jgi:hypothetical protein